MSERRTKTLDVHIGSRILAARHAAGLTREQLAAKLGVSSSQIQKYEAGENRVYASRLLEIADLFDKSILWFFEGRLHRNGAQAPQELGSAS
jgi:transcriptional regulator with XRE-family HTH domain